MNLSVLDLFTIGIGPSSSHTVGPMRAAKRFVEALVAAELLRACLKIPWASCFRTQGPMARREEGGYPQRSLTDEQQSQRALGAKTLRAAGLLPGAGVGSAVTAHCGDAPASPPWPQPKTLAAGPHAILRQALNRTARVEAHLYGSLALTGKSHGTDRGVLLGWEGETPEDVDVDAIAERLRQIRAGRRLRLGGRQAVAFDEARDLQYHASELLPAHPNGMRFVAKDAQGETLARQIFYSVGGGFVVSEADAALDRVALHGRVVPFPYRSGDDLLRMGRESGLSASEMTLRNESCWRSEAETHARLLRVWRAMEACAERGCHTAGALPGPLRVARRAPRIFRELTERPEVNLRDPLVVLDWVSMWAMAVNEENAAGGRVVTAPTNGAAGVVPAVLHYLVRVRAASEDTIVRYLLTAGAIGLLYKRNASISGAEVGCQGEVGVACSMAAAALTEALGGSVPQVENGAEIGMEHNLGLTCDPVGGLVQVPCIERNAMGAVKAINAARLALAGDGTHRVSLDRVIATMRQTGADMSTKYKETSRGGLAVNVVEC